MENLKHWQQLAQVPVNRLKKIEFGYLKGKSDINPQWRIMAMTEVFGVVGHGWNWRIVRTWTETGADGQVMCFSEVAVKVKIDGVWGDEFSGIGGSLLCELSKGVLKSNDEGYKMATTDALGVAFKCLGVAADVYLGNFDGSKYATGNESALVAPPQNPPLADERMAGAVQAILAGTTTLDAIQQKHTLTAAQIAVLTKGKA